MVSLPEFLSACVFFVRAMCVRPKRPIAADRCLLRASTTDLLPCDISHASDSAVPRSLNQPTPLFPHLVPFFGGYHSHPTPASRCFPRWVFRPFF